MDDKRQKSFLGVNLSDIEKANYLSRFFGIFYEGLIGFWLETKGFNLKGRPSVYNQNDRYLRRTFDYAVEKNGKYFIGEAKGYIAYEDFTQIELTADLLDEYIAGSYNDTFHLFLELGSREKPYSKYRFRYKCDEYKKTRFSPDGKMLFWTRVKESEVERIKKKYHLSYIFSLEQILVDMMAEMKSNSDKGKEYSQYIRRRKDWANELFTSLSKA